MTAVLIGYLVVHLTQHTLTPHFHFGEETHHEEMVSKGIGYLALVGLLPHSFFDGVAIGSGFLGNRALGIFLIFTAVALHKVPTGVSLASVMLASGSSTNEHCSASYRSALQESSAPFLLRVEHHSPPCPARASRVFLLGATITLRHPT